VAVFNRRNAAVGWLALFAGKRILKRKAKGALPALDPESKRPNRSAIALVLASVVGVATFWRRRSGDEETDSTS
jgi:hypothetical protein